jgi:hypothetical protein
VTGVRPVRSYDSPLLIQRFAPVLILLALFTSACGDDADVAPVDAPETGADEPVEDTPPDESLEQEVVEDPEPEEPEPEPEPEPTEGTTDLPANSPGVAAERTARFFADAVADGDEETAALFASAAVLDFFAPWESNAGAAFQSIIDDVFFLILGPGDLVSCRLDANLDVATCAQESEPDVLDDEVADLAFDDPAGYYLVEYVTPELGGFPETREGGIVRSLDAYVVDYQNCCTDDTLYASVTSVEDNAAFTIYGPDGEPVAEETMSVNLTLQQGGEYWIVVGSTRGNATYTIDFGLSQDAS